MIIFIFLYCAHARASVCGKDIKVTKINRYIKKNPPLARALLVTGDPNSHLVHKTTTVTYKRM